jgi:hypothetical protein
MCMSLRSSVIWSFGVIVYPRFLEKLFFSSSFIFYSLRRGSKDPTDFQQNHVSHCSCLRLHPCLGSLSDLLLGATSAPEGPADRRTCQEAFAPLCSIQNPMDRPHFGLCNRRPQVLLNATVSYKICTPREEMGSKHQMIN